MIGTTLGGRYEIKDVLGQGGFAIVYRARQISIDRDVAVKVLTLDASQDDTIGRRFEAEAKIISQLRHPNTLKLIDFGQTQDNRIYLVMELLEGSALDHLLQKGPLPPRQVVSIIKQAAAALEEAHDLGVVHRDIKPGNIFVEQVGRRQVVKVLDFGIAKVHSQQSHTMTGQMFGTPLYMSPEQVKGLEVDGRSDLYSLGVVAYQCLTGDVPFNGATPYSILMKHANEAPPAMLSVNPEMLHADLEALVIRLLAKEPGERFESAAELMDHLDFLDAQLKQRGEVDPSRSTIDSIAPQSVSGAFDRTIVSTPRDLKTSGLEQHSSPPKTVKAQSSQAAPVHGKSGRPSQGFELPEDLPKKSKMKWVIAVVVLLGGVGFVFTQRPFSKNDASKLASTPEASQNKTVAKNATEPPKVVRGTDEKNKGNSEGKLTGSLNVDAPKAASAPPTEKPILNPNQPPKSSAKQVQTAVTPTASKKNAPTKKLIASKRTQLSKAVPPAKRPSQQTRKRPAQTVKVDKAVARLKIVLQPKKAVYDLSDRPTVRAIAYGANGQVLKNVSTIKWSVVGPARKKGNRIHFTKDGKGHIQACSQKVCAKTRFMGLDSSGLP